MTFHRCVQLYHHHHNHVDVGNHGMEISVTLIQFPCAPLQSVPAIPRPLAKSQPLATTDQLSVPVIFVFSRVSLKWNHTECNLLCLTYFTWRKGFDIHPHCFEYGQFFFIARSVLWPVSIGLSAQQLMAMGIVLVFACYGESCYESSCTSICVGQCFPFCRINTQE